MVAENQCWLIASYIPTTLFSLKSSYSTSSGGKSLFVPTPYACKLAMVDAAYRVEGETLAKWLFNIIKHRQIRFKPPKHLTVNHTFVKIKREPKEKKPGKPYISSIAFREFCYYNGDLQIAINIDGLSTEEVDKIVLTLAHINYFGKRGSLVQYTGTEQFKGVIKGFTLPVPSTPELVDPDVYRVTQYLDDLGEYSNKDFFERINSYTTKSIELGKHRVLKPFLLPYRQVSSSNSFTYYRNGSDE
jgi:CRISPR/Cas system-associated protein Cas5 (RAMP superfamily)